MFTGIVADIGRVESVAALAAGKRLRVATPLADASLQTGESIAVDGCCLTVTAFAPGWFEADVSRESLDRTNLAEKGPGSPVNLERALRLGDRLGGHWVQGHVDGVGHLAAAREAGESHEIEIDVPAELLKYIVEKGSLTVSGVSLTVNAVKGRRVAINLIPHTWAHTTLGLVPAGAPVNLEVDILAKHAETLLAHYRSNAT